MGAGGTTGVLMGLGVVVTTNPLEVEVGQGVGVTAGGETGDTFGVGVTKARVPEVETHLTPSGYSWAGLQAKPGVGVGVGVEVPVGGCVEYGGSLAMVAEHQSRIRAASSPRHAVRLHEQITSGTPMATQLSYLMVHSSSRTS